MFTFLNNLFKYFSNNNSLSTFRNRLISGLEESLEEDGKLILNEQIKALRKSELVCANQTLRLIYHDISFLPKYPFDETYFMLGSAVLSSGLDNIRLGYWILGGILTNIQFNDRIIVSKLQNYKLMNVSLFVDPMIYQPRSVSVFS